LRNNALKNPAMREKGEPKANYPCRETRAERRHCLAQGGRKMGGNKKLVSLQRDRRVQAMTKFAERETLLGVKKNE